MIAQLGTVHLNADSWHFSKSSAGMAVWGTGFGAEAPARFRRSISCFLVGFLDPLEELELL